MIVKVDGEELAVAEGLTFAELLKQVQSRLDQRVLVELRVDGQVVSQSMLDEIQDEPARGEIELFSLDAHDLVAELTKQALRYLNQLEAHQPSPEEFPQVVEGFIWLNRALALIPLGIGFPELGARTRRLIQENEELLEWLQEAAEEFARVGDGAEPEELEQLRSRLAEEISSYRSIFQEIRERL